MTASRVFGSRAAAVVAVLTAFAATAALAGFEAGFSRVEATPPLGIPIPGCFSHRVADGVLDPLGQLNALRAQSATQCNCTKSGE